jgi:hypothetical protein
VDVGWVGAATDATIVDLAGVTDVTVAARPGGHTSKRLPEGFLEQRGADALVLLLAPGAEVATPWSRSPFARAVEHRVARQAAGLPFTVVAAPRLLGTEQKYLVLKLRK